MSTTPSADRIEQVAFGFMASKVLFGAIEFGVFTELAKQPLDGQALIERLGLHPRSARDFLDALVALGMLERSGELYSSTTETDFYLDRVKPTYIGNLFEMWNVRAYPFWAHLSTGSRPGSPKTRSRAARTFSPRSI
jgi:hypothetical protein